MTGPKKLAISDEVRKTLPLGICIIYYKDISTNDRDSRSYEILESASKVIPMTAGEKPISRI